MTQNSNQDSMKEMLEVFKGDYKSPTKVWLWGKAINEWAGLIILGGILLLIFVTLLIALSSSERAPIPTQAEVTLKQEAASQQNIVPNLAEVVKFLQAGERSLSKRQETLQELLEALNSYADESLDQQEIENKLGVFSRILDSCNFRRSSVIETFSEINAPYEALKNVETLINKDIFRMSDKLNIIDPQKENEQWGVLCSLCQSQVKKANTELVQLLKRRTSSEGNAVNGLAK